MTNPPSTAPDGATADSGVIPLRPSRFRCIGGGVEEWLGQKWREVEDPEGLLAEWRRDAAKYAAERNERYAGLFARAADDLEIAVCEQRRWKRCGDFYPLANVGRSAFASCPELIETNQKPGA